MRESVRIVVRILLLSVGALGLAAGLLGPMVDDDVEVSVVAMVTVAGAAIAYEIIRAARKSGRLTWQQATPLWAQRTPPVLADPPGTLGEWEGLLASARPNEARGRVRFLRRMTAIARPETRPLVEAMAQAEPEEFDALVARFIEESGID